jgi:UDP:flavonoid glycosyltransferase YjiC (YdhE family)
MPTIACFVSPHGFGHAARISAIMDAIARRRPNTQFEIFTTAPEWFFRDSLAAEFSYHETVTDVGLAQATPFDENVAETVRRLDDLVPFREELVSALARTVRGLGCSLVLCDIAPLGIAVAEAAGLPSVLVENFTWDWIYAGYVEENPRLASHAEYLGEIFRRATLHIQTEPVCDPRPGTLVVPPVAREPRASSSEIRVRLGVADDSRMVLVTTGGIPDARDYVASLAERARALPGVSLVVPVGDRWLRAGENVVVIPHHSGFFHPDLVNAADAVVGKLGYSTVAEVFRAGVPFGYVERPRFRESDVLAAFVRSRIASRAIPEDDLLTAAYVDLLPELLAAPRIPPAEPNGAAMAADAITPYVE